LLLLLGAATTGAVVGIILVLLFLDGFRRAILQEVEKMSCKFTSAEFCFREYGTSVTDFPFLLILSFLLTELLFVGDEDRC